MSLFSKNKPAVSSNPWDEIDLDREETALQVLLEIIRSRDESFKTYQDNKNQIQTDVDAAVTYVDELAKRLTED